MAKKDTDLKERSPYWGATTKLVIGLTIVAIFGALLVRFQNLIGPLILAFILTFILHPVASALVNHTNLSWRMAVNVIFLVMLVIIAQRLIRRVCTHCGEQVTPSPELLEYWGIPPGDNIRFMKAKGCSHCLDTGYRGRVGLYEILYINDAVRDMILSGKTAKEISRLAHDAGQLRTLKEDAARKVMDRITTPEEAMSALQVK